MDETTEGPEFLALREVTVVRGGRTILRVEGLRIGPGSRVAVVGPSGSGKSTLLRLCSFMLRPAAGSVTFRGRTPASQELPILRRSLPLVAQEPLLAADTVRASFLLPFAFASARAAAPPSPERMRECLELVELEPLYLERASGTLSGGEKQRAAIACALCLEPEALLLDEPTSALDLVTASRLFDNITAHRPELTLLLSTHSPELIERTGSQVLVRAGRIERVAHGLDLEALKLFLERSS